MKFTSIRETGKFRGIIAEDKENIDDFCLNHEATETDIYRAQFYTQMALKEMDKLRRLIKESHRKKKKSGKDSKRQHSLLMLQRGIFLMTYNTLKEHIDSLTVKTDIQMMINQKLTDLRDQAALILEGKKRKYYPGNS